MQLLSTVSVLILALSGLGLAKKPEPSPVGLTPLLTFNLPLVIDTLMIDIPAGKTRAERYLNNGTVTGAFNGSVHGGLAAPKIYPQPDGSLVTETDVTLYGITDDGEYWLTHTTGVSNNVHGYVSGQIYIGGKYTNLTHDFLFAAVDLNVTTLIATVQLFVPYRTS